MRSFRAVASSKLERDILNQMFRAMQSVLSLHYFHYSIIYIKLLNKRKIQRKSVKR